MSKVVIFGTASFAEVVHFYLENESPHEVVAFTVHGDRIESDTFRDLPIVPYEALTERYPPDDFEMFIAIGYARVNRTRAEVYDDAKSRGYELISYVHPKCTRIGEFPIGDNCFIFEDNTIQPFVTIGNDVVLWSGNHIGHHATIEDHCFLASHVVVSGHCRVGSHSFIGVNSTLRDGIAVGRFNVVGAGALLMRSTGDKEVYVGPRTKPFPKSSDEIDF